MGQPDLPRPEQMYSNEDHWLAAICDRLDVLIAHLPPRPSPVSTPGAGQVELTEPAVATTDLTEPRPRQRTRGGKPT